MIAHMLLENISCFAVFLKRWNLEVKKLDLKIVRDRSTPLNTLYIGY